VIKLNERNKIFFTLIILFVFTLMIGSASAGDANQTGSTVSVALDDSSQVDGINIDVTDQTIKDVVSTTKDVDDSDVNASDEIDSAELKNTNGLKSSVSVSSEKADVLGVPADQDVLGATLASFQTLIDNTGNGGTIAVQQDYVVGTNTADWRYLTINKNLIIQGRNNNDNAYVQRTFDANGRGGIFQITGARTVTFRYITFTNAGTGQNDGGAIYLDSGSTVVFENCRFINNVRNGDGAVVSAYQGGTLTFRNCEFTGNSASGNGGVIYAPGYYYTYDRWGRITGIYSANTVLSFTNCNFQSNHADGSGSVVYQDWAQLTDGTILMGSSCTLTDCNLINNAATGDAALYLSFNTISIDGCNFEGNTGYADGGAIHAYRTANQLNVRNSNFINNKATSTAENSEGRGGALRVSFAPMGVNIDNCLFEGNSAMFGGAYYTPANERPTTVTNSRFRENIAVSNGGAVYCNANSSTFTGSEFTGNEANNGAGIFLAYALSNVKVNDCDFTDNKAINEGAAIMGIYNENNIQVDNSRFNGNTALNGGAIALGQNSNDFSLTNSEFNGNHASGYGGCVYFESTGDNVYIYNTDFIDNFASSGGAIHLFSSRMDDSYNTVDIIDCTFHDNNCTSPDARYGGSAIGLNWANDVTISGCTFDLNHASSNGAIMVDYCYDVNVDNCDFTNNYAGRFGGAFYAYHAVGDADVTFTKCTFDNNTAARTGGAIATTLFSVNYENLGNVYKNWAITDCDFTNNKAELSAGALYLPWTTGLVINNIPFDNNTAGSYGAMYWSGDSLDIHDVNFTNNKAKDGDCGALFIGIGTGTAGAQSVIDTVIFENNTAYSNGGALSGTASNVDITNDKFKNNSAWYGGAIYWNGGSNVNIDKNEFIANSANNAGAVDIYGTKNTNIHNSVFVNNTATNQAGAVWFNSEGGSIYSCDFTNNTAGTNAGAIILDSTSQTVRDCKFENNVAGGKGGAIYDTGSGADNSIFIRDSTFTGNKAYDGAGAYISDGRVTQIYNGTFIDNLASHNGGGAYVIIDAVAYVDYDLFNHTGIEEHTTERITKSIGPRTYIYSSLFQNSNIDYYMNVSAVVSGLTAVITVNVPVDANKSRNGKVVFDITYTNQSGSYKTQYVLDNFDGSGIVTLNLPSSEVGHYDVTVGFSEETYLYKQFSVSYNVTDPRGDFEILQGLINDAIANHFTELDLTRSYTFTPGNETNPLDFNVYDIEINAPLIINGNGWTVNALGYCRIFTINANNVTLKDLKLINGANATDGGAINWIGNNGSVEHTSFINNTATREGGAIYYAPTAVDCKVLSCTFENNTAGDDGGAIDWNATRGVLNDSVFINNKANDNGGALCREVNADGGYGYNNIFYNNTAEQGGAIAWMKAENINIDHYTFVDNTADLSGGAIYVGEGSGNCVVKNSYFEDNNVTSTTVGHGGAIEWYAKEGSVDNSQFVDNHAYKGGAIFVGQTAGDINITNSMFANNSALTHGGAIDANASSVIMQSSEFYNNTAEYGGAVYVGGAGEHNSVTSCVFIGNNATENGGAVDWAASNGNVLDSTFEYNHAKYGGAVFVGGLAESGSIVNSIFNHNTAEEHGGALDWNATIGRLSGSKFFNNSAKYGGATYRGANSTGGFGYNNVYISNHAEIDGGAIDWNSAGGNITYSEFYNNTAGRNGGAVYVGAVGATAYITDAIFVNNTAKDNGGAVDWAASNGHILRSTFEYNNATNGGAVFVGGLGEGGSIVNSTFNHNHADDKGGALDWNATIGRLTGSTFFNNSAQLGGATYRGANSTGGYGRDNVYISNSAVLDGGAIYWNSAGGNVTHSEFYNNTAGRNGGAVYVGAVGSTSYITDALFVGNNATVRGGAVDWDASNGNVLRSTFEYNNADYGGAVFIGGTSGNGTIVNSTFNHNHAGENGGALDWNSTIGRLINSTFFNNTAKYGGATYRGANSTGGFGYNNKYISNHAEINGGAIDWNAAGGNITHSEFRDNTAGQNGGAVYVGANGTTAYITDAVFTNNSAGIDGGAVNWAASNGHILTSRFDYNTAGQNGGAVFIGGSSGNGTIINSTFNYNHAGENGGAIDWNSTIGKLTGSNFTFNSARYGGATFRGANATGGYGYNNIYISNYAEVNGGAIDWNATGGNITHSKFYNNTAGENGGALFVGAHGATAYITEAIFENNKAENRGGAIDIYASNTHIINSNFTTNTASYGGAVFAGHNALVSDVTNSTFVQNSARYNGGAIDWNASAGTIVDSTFDQNTAQYGGAVFVGASTDNGYVNGSHFTKNSASIRGGAIDWNGSSGHVFDSIFEENEAVNGGALYLGSGAAKGHIENSTFISNRADRNNGKGGAILFNSIDEVYVGLSNFTSNSADHGGAMYIDECDSAMIETSKFTSNSANNDGAIHWQGENGTLRNSEFTSNTATQDAGAIGWKGVASDIYNVTFNKNTAGRKAGAIYWVNVTDDKIYNVTFKENQAFDGGAIYWVGGNGTIYDAIFNSNVAFEEGGAVYLDGLSGNALRNSTFTSNKATGYFNPDGIEYGDGGALYITNSDNMDLKDLEFNKNTAALKGGAICINGSDDSIIHDLTFNDNSANKVGGTIYWNSSSNATISDISIDKSTAHDEGGAIYLIDMEANLDNITLNDVTSTYASGGAIYANGNVTINDAKISNFKSLNDVATAILFDGGNSSLSNSTLEGNNAIVINESTTVHLTKNTIRDNPDDGYAVLNGGTLYLEDNDFDDVIINAGVIETQTYTVVLNNQTLVVAKGTNALLNASIVDDTKNNDIVSVESFNFKDLTSGKDISSFYSGRYNYGTYESVEQGKYIISASDVGLKKNEIKTGTLLVKANNRIDINVTQIHEGEKVTIKAELVPADPNFPYTGNITLVVSGKPYNVAIEDGIATLVLYNLSANTYSLTATYPGDEYHFNATNSTFFIVNLRETLIRVVANSVLYGQNVTAIATTNANGTVTFLLNGRKVAEIVNGTAKWNITGLEPGKYDLTVIYPGNEYFAVNFNETSFEVYKNNATIDSIDFARVVAVGQNNEITVTMGNVTSGMLVIEVNGVNYTAPIVNKVAKLNVNLPIGKDYTVRTFFTGDAHYNATSKDADYTFEVTDKNVTYIKIDAIRVVEIDDEMIVTLETNSTSTDWTVYVNDKPVVVNSTNQFVADTSVADSFVIIAMLAENENYSSGYNTTVFNVIKHNSTVSIDIIPDQIHYVGDSFVINITNNTAANVTINGKVYTVDANGNVNVDTTELTAGEYIVSAVITENNKYYGNSTSKTFRIVKYNSTITSVEVTPTVEVGQNITITVTMGNITSGTVEIEVYGINHTATIENGVAKLNLTATRIGNNFPVNAYFLGDNKHNASSKAGNTFNVTGKYKTIINITVDSVVVVDSKVIVTVKTNTTAPLIVEMDGKRVYLNETGQFLANTSVAGNHMITATTEESALYYGAFNSTVYTVIKHNSTALIEVGPEYYVGSEFTIKVTSNTTVNVTINGKQYAVKADGTVDIDTKTLAAGDYIVRATVTENDKYYGNVTTKAFEIVKYDAVISDVNIKAPVVNVAYNNTITVTMGNVTSGTILIGINGTNYSVPINNSIATLSVGLPVGKDYNVTVYFLGDDTHNPVNVTGGTYEVTGKNVTEITIDVESVVVIDSRVIVTVNTNSTAPLTVQVNGVNVTLNETNQFVADTSVAGTFTITAVAPENGDYASGFNSTTFTVIKHNSTALIEVDPVHYVGTEFTINVTSNTTVNVTINGKQYAVNPDGTVVIDTTQLAAGDYIVTATVTENDKYYGNVTNKTFTVIKYNADIDVVTYAPVVNVAYNNTITVRMGNVTSGTVIISINGTNYSVPIIDKIATLSVGLPVGKNYTVDVYFTGDDRYNPVNVTAGSFEVTDKNVTIINITAAKVVFVDDNMIVTLDTNSSADLIVYVNGKEVTLDENNQFVANTSVSGTYTIVARTAENEHYAAGFNSTTYEVIKYNSTVSVDVDPIHFVEDVFTIKVTNNTAVNVTVNGKPYTVKADGTVDIDTTKLEAGEYIVNAVIAENYKYNGNSSNATFTIVKYASVIDSVVVTPEVEIGQNITVTVTMGNITSGTVLVEVHGLNYSVPIVNGVATLNIPATIIANDTPVMAYFEGDYKHNASSKSGNSFNVTGKYPTVINITVEKVVKVGDKLIVTVETNSSAALHVEVNGVPVELNATGQFIADTSVSGNYTITATTDEVDYYYSGFNSTTFEVIKHNSTVSIDVGPTHFVEDVFTITITNNTAVNVTINGKPYTVKADGTVDIDTTKLEAGEYIVTATITESGMYYGNTTTATFNVVKYNAVIESVESKPVVSVGQNNTIVVTMGNVTSGVVTIEVNGQNYTAPIVDGVAKLNVSLPVGKNYPVKAYFLGDYKHNATSMAGSVFEVTDKNVTQIIIDVESILVVDSEVYVTVTTNSSSPVVVEVNGKPVSVVDNRFKADTSEIGKYTIVARTTENEYYAAGYNSTVYTVIKHNSTVDIVVNPVNFVEDSFTITVNSNATPVVTINGKTYSVKADGTVDIDTTTLTAGEYIVTATVVENDKYYANSTTATFKVVKYNAEIVSVDSKPVVGVGYNNTIVVTMGNVTTGVVTIEVNGQNYTAPIVDGVAKLNVSLPVGKNYPVKAYFLGDYKYNATSKVGQPFEVTDKNVTVITIDVADVVVIDSQAIVTVKTNSSAPLYVYVNGKYQEVIDNQFVADTSVAGTYMIVAITAENEDYSSGYNSTMFEVVKHNSTVDIKVNPIHSIGDKFTINITSNATPVVTINGKQYAVNPDGTVDIDTTTLSAGEYIVTATVTENGKYYGNTKSATFVISKLESKVNVTVEDTPYRGNIEITVEVPVEQTGSVVVTVEGKNYTAVIKDGVAKVNVTGLDVDRYTVDVTYLGDENFDAVSNSTAFNVTPIELPAEVIAFNVTVDQNPMFVIGVDSDFKGNVTIVVDGVTYDGDVKLLTYLDKLTAGNKTADVTFYGDANYLDRTMKVNFTVSKLDSTDEIKVIDQGNGTVVVVVPGNATGNVTIKVGNDTFNATVINGTAIVNLTNVTPGVHNITVIYSGDENHTNATVDATVNIPKLVTPIDVTTVDVNVGDVATITVTVPEGATGTITIEIDGVSYTEEIVDGKATFTVENLTAGIKTVAVDYVGDNNYTGNHTTANFTVSKIVPEITVNATGVDAGNSVVIEVTAPSDVEWPVLVDINGKGYYVNITDGKGTLVIPDMAGGDYNVTVKYLGDAKYLNNTAETAFKVSKVPSTVSVSAEDITVGEVAIIEIAVPKDATGNVTTVIVNGETYTVPVVGGKGILVVRDLPAGEYTVQVTYNGDGKYETSNNSTTFKVNKVDADDIKVIDQGNGTVVVVVPGNGTGNVTIKVGNDTYNATVINGTAVVNLTNVTPGEHNITVIYSGDENHTNATVDATVTIPKLVTPIDVTVANIDVGEAATIVVTVPEDATGEVTIEINGVKYTEEIIDGKATFTVENLTAGIKTVAVDYIGDNNYTGNHTTANFTVSKIVPEITVNATGVDAGNSVVIEVTAPSDVEWPVLVDINGKGYYVNITDGKGTLVIPDMAGGDYNVTVKYLGDSRYLNNTAEGTFKVSKVPSTVSVSAEDITVGEVAIIEIAVPKDATGNVTTVIVNGETYTVPVVDGKGILVVRDLPVGEYTVQVTYNGDGKYETSNNSTTFKVNKIDTDDIKVIDQGNGTVVVVVPGNATGNVTVKVGNDTYNATVINGTAVINITNITAGEHNITVIYSGDENHTNTTINTTIKVKQAITPIDISVADINVGDVATIVVTVNDDVTGDITIEIDGKRYTQPIVDGKATFTVENLTAGEKSVFAMYEGDEYYAPNHASESFKVSKLPSEVTATIEDTKVGDNVTITVKVPSDATGQVLIDIDGVGYYVNVTDGTGSIEIPRIPSGVYEVGLTYTGDDKYLPSTNTSKFNVDKVEPFVIPTAHDIYVGQVETITIQVPADATGTVTVVIAGDAYTFTLNEGTLGVVYSEGKKYTVAVSGGNGELVVTGLPEGEYVVSVKYNGDDKYLQCSNETTFRVLASPDVPKHDTPIKVDVDDIKVGETAVVTVTVPKNATGSITIEIDAKNYTAEIKDGKAIFEVKGLSAGDRTVAVTYDGDEHHLSNFTTGQFTVSKVPSTVSATSKDITVGKDEIITVTVPRDATGRVLVDIDGVGYYADIVNGKAKVIVPELPSGKYTAKVTYEGDGKYLPSTTTTKFTVTKVKTPISATGDKIEQGEDATVVVKVPSDATGTVTITVDGKKYTAEVENGKAVFNIPGLTKGDHDVTAVYSGDKKYEANDTITDIDVHYEDGPNPHYDGEKHVNAGLAKYPTGNPILVLLLVLLALGSTQLRRFKK